MKKTVIFITVVAALMNRKKIYAAWIKLGGENIMTFRDPDYWIPKAEWISKGIDEYESGKLVDRPY